jgi:hypothetical protein
LQATGTFTYSKALQTVEQNIFNPQGLGRTYQTWDQPFLFNANIVYTVQNFFPNRKLLSTITKDWQVGAFIQDGSGFLLTPPSATTVNKLFECISRGFLVYKGQSPDHGDLAPRQPGDPSWTVCITSD